MPPLFAKIGIFSMLFITYSAILFSREIVDKERIDFHD